MRFAGAGRPESKAVLASVDPFAARQFQNQRLIQRRLGGEVERIEALGLWEARQLNAALDCAALPIRLIEMIAEQHLNRYKVLEGALRERIRTIIWQDCRELGIQIVSGV